MNTIKQILPSGWPGANPANKKKTKIKKFGTFAGVFTPNVLTILGVIMYLRLGWVVGNAGFLGTVAIILLAKMVTVTTGLAMSSITTNIRIGAGGAYSIISKSLGLEAGGSIGIPFYIAQTLSAALYIIGFTEGWLRVFPNHTPFIVATIAWLGLLTISYISAEFALRVQFLIMAIMGLSIVSFLLSPAAPVQDFVWIGNFEEAGFWQAFAIFFPAVTGIMAGANLSGDLKDPRRSIPIGTMSSIVVTMLIYISIAFVVARVALPQEALSNQMVMVDKALWGPAVIAGIMGATLSSALGSMLGAPRLLQALAEQRTIPYHKFLAAKTPTNEPRNAIIVTGILIEAALLVGNLDLLAALITMFFLVTYGMLNVVVFTQQSLNIISFRPTFKVPRLVPFIGAVSCLFMMFLINPTFSIIALIIIGSIYAWLVRKELEADWGDIRGGIFIALAERAARIAEKFPRHMVAWKPDLLVPIEDPRMWAGSLWFIRNITAPSGSMFAFTVTKDEAEDRAEIQEAIEQLLTPLKAQNILSNSVVIEDSSFLHGAKLVIQTLKGGAFRPNSLFLTVNRIIPTQSPTNDATQQIVTHDETISELVRLAVNHKMGAILLRQHPQMAFGMQRDINLWLRDKTSNWHLAVLVALQLQLNWGGKINLITAASDAGSERRLSNFLNRLSDDARLPSTTELHVLVGAFKETLPTAPRADLNIFGLALIDGQVPLEFIREVSDLAKSSCVFVIDSGQESALV